MSDVLDELTDEQVAAMELDEEWLDYLALALTGFSKGTANVTPEDRRKLLPLLRYYAKKPHPFTACVRDNRKRFGPRAEAICAVVKDLIVGNTRWRGKGKPYVPRAVAASEQPHDWDELVAEWEVPAPDEFYTFCAEATPEEIDEMVLELQAASPGTGTTEPTTATGGGIDLPPASANYRDATDPAQSCANCVHFQRHPAGDDGFCDLYNCSSDAAYVSDGWAPANTPAGTNQSERELLHALLGEEAPEDMVLMGEMFLEGGAVMEEDGSIWKVVAREGTWKYSPGPGQKPVEKPLTFIRGGKTEVGDDKIVVSLDEVLANFKEGAKEHVTIPLTHADNVMENTGFVRDLRMGQDDEGRATLEAKLDFTEPDVKGKVLRKTIANVSSGILFDYIRKDIGKRFGAVLGHVALTNSPWLNGMKPFGVEASDGPVTAMGFSEVHLADTLPKGVTTCMKDGKPGFMGPDSVCHVHDGRQQSMRAAMVAAANAAGHMNMSEDEILEYVRANGGGDTGMSELLTELGLSEDEVKARLKEHETLKAKDRQANIDAKCSEWETAKKAPAMIAEARTLMMGDTGSKTLLLSEDGKESEATVTEVVERIMAKAPSINLSEEDKTNGQKGASDDDPDDDTFDENTVELTAEEKSEASRLFLEERMTQTDAIKAVLAKRQTNGN